MIMMELELSLPLSLLLRREFMNNPHNSTSNKPCGLVGKRAKGLFMINPDAARIRPCRCPRLLLRLDTLGEFHVLVLVLVMIDIDLFLGCNMPPAPAGWIVHLHGWGCTFTTTHL